MPKFTDRLGREWKLEIDVSQLAPLREAGLNVGAVVRDAKAFDAIDLEGLGRILWILVAEQAKERAVDPEGFARGLNGPTLFAASEELWGAILDFSQRPAVAAAIRQKLPALMTEIDRKAIAAVEARLAIAGLSGSKEPAGASPGSSASIPEG